MAEALAAHAQVSAREKQRVLRVGEANHALVRDLLARSSLAVGAGARRAAAAVSAGGCHGRRVRGRRRAPLNRSAAFVLGAEYLKSEENKINEIKKLT